LQRFPVRSAIHLRLSALICGQIHSYLRLAPNVSQARLSLTHSLGPSSLPAFHLRLSATSADRSALISDLLPISKAFGLSDRGRGTRSGGRVPHSPVVPAMPVWQSRVSVNVIPPLLGRFTRKRTRPHPGRNISTKHDQTLRSSTVAALASAASSSFEISASAATSTSRGNHLSLACQSVFRSARYLLELPETHQ
jgi:hypothetical protein